VSAATSPDRRQPTRTPRTAWIVGGAVALVIAIAAVVAIVSSGGDDSDSSPALTAPAGSAAPGTAGAGTAVAGTSGPTGGATALPVLDDMGPVTVSGTQLPPFDRGSDPAIGRQAPAVTGVGFDGSPRSITPGTPTLVVFLAHWCPHCRREVPRLVEWQADGAVPAGVDVIGVATGTNPDRDNFPPSDWLVEEAWPFPVMVDDEQSTAALAFGLSAYPYFVLLDSEGRVVWRQSGEVATDDLTETIATALAA
jgi:thiol-disulfide isomerase/thioredoxin